MADADGRAVDPTSEVQLDWRSPDSLGQLCFMAREHALLEHVEVLAVATGEERRGFLLTVRVTENLSLASERFTWEEVRPPAGIIGASAARYVLDCVEQIVQKTERGLVEYAWLSVASELREVRRILQEAQED